MCSPPIKDENRHCDKEITGWTQLEVGNRTDFYHSRILVAQLLKLYEKNQNKCDQNEEDAFVIKYLWGCSAHSFCIQYRAHIVSKEALSSAVFTIDEWSRVQNGFQQLDCQQTGKVKTWFWGPLDLTLQRDTLWNQRQDGFYNDSGYLGKVNLLFEMLRKLSKWLLRCH